ncbi:MAG: MMPL family transporter, partial [Thermoleophilaceae bacterium]
MLGALARLADRRPWRVVGVAIVLALVAGALGGSVADHLFPYGADDPATDSVKATERLERAAGMHPAAGLVGWIDTPAGPSSPASCAKVQRVARQIGSDRAVARVDTFYGTHARALVARDGSSQYVAAHYRPVSDKAEQDAAERIGKRLSGQPGVMLGGWGAASQDVNKTVEHDLRRAEMLVFPLLFLLSLVFFRSLVAAALPLLVGGLAIVGTFLVLRVASELTDVSIFALNLTTGLGLGLAIDYSLFIVSRYREEIARDGPGLGALQRTLATAGRTVLFSSLTVAAALASLLVFPQRFLYSMGIGGTFVALVAAAVSLIVLPAVLAILGTRVNALAPGWLQRRAENDARAASAGGWYRLSRFVMRRPGAIALVSAAVMIAAGIPFLRITLTAVDSSVLPKSAESRQVDSVLARDFAPNRAAPTYVAVAGRPGPAVNAYAQRLRRLPGAAAVTQPRPVGRDTTLIQVISRHRELADQSQDLVRDIRDVPSPTEALAGGRTADFVDFKASLARHLPLAFAIVTLATLIVLFLMTGSVLLPIKAVIMNVLTLSAALGILVLIFQDGRLESLLDYTSQNALEVTMPVLLFAVVFGLSTDYGVFLLARIKEARDNGASDSESVAIGLERTGRIVTAAALLFSVAIGAFATSQIIFIKENGVGTAIAVLIDASIIRALLVPSLMGLLGRWNWWAPRPLRRLHARVGLSHGSPAGAG